MAKATPSRVDVYFQQVAPLQRQMEAICQKHDMSVLVAVEIANNPTALAINLTPKPDGTADPTLIDAYLLMSARGSTPATPATSGG